MIQRGPKQGSYISCSEQQHIGIQMGGGGGQQGLILWPAPISNICIAFDQRLMEKEKEYLNLFLSNKYINIIEE